MRIPRSSPGEAWHAVVWSETDTTYGNFLNRAGAGFIDVFATLITAYALSLALVAALGDVVEIDDPIISFASEKTIANDLPSTEIAAGGVVVKTTQRSIVERNFFGLATQTVRRTHVELTVDPNKNSEHARDAADLALLKASGTSGDVLIDPKSHEDLARPSLSLISIVTYFVLLGLCEGFLMAGASPGKSLFGLRVIGAQGEPMTLGRAFARNLAKLMSLVTLLIGFLMVLWTKRHQALHDMMADCLVVKTGSKS